MGSTVAQSSFLGKKWIVNSYDERLAEALTQRFGLPDIVGQVLSARGITLDTADDFLDPRLKTQLPDPFHLKDMAVAATRMAAAITQNEKIVVFGDYDVDGATSSALLIRYGQALGITITAYIPDRIAEGYGPNANAMRLLAEQGAKLVVTVDCGVTAHEPLQAAKDAGLDVIVLDHHVAEPQLPPAVAVVNPNRVDETSPHRHMAAVGVTFLFLVALHKTLRAAGYFEGKKEPDLLSELDLVALGTVCDMVALTGINRAFVTQGLKVLAQSRNIGLNNLLGVSKSSGMPDTYTAGFLLGPRINAGGRVGKSDLGVRLLSSLADNEAQGLAIQLNGLNDERKELERGTLEEAYLKVPDEASSCVMVDEENWHPGVIGLIASRLKEKYNRPSFATAFSHDIGKGSCRSVKGVDIGSIVIAAKQEGLLINGGGHAMAAGYTVPRSAYEAFKTFVEERVSRVLAETPMEAVLPLDGVLTVGGVNIDLANKLTRLAPFGMGNPEPRFAVMDAIFIKADPVGQNHLSITVKDDMGNFMRAMAWRAMDNEIGQNTVKLAKGTRVHIAGHIRLNSYAMRDEARLIVDDVAAA